MKAFGKCPDCGKKEQVGQDPEVHQRGSGKIMYVIEVTCENCGASNQYVTGLTRT